jgi:hypothetical protein
MTRLIDDRGRLLGKISVIDILVLLVVAAIAVFLGLRGTDGVVSVESVRVKLTFVTQPIDSRMLDAYTALGALKDMSGRTIGTIEQAEVSEFGPVVLVSKDWESSLQIPVAPNVVFVVSAQGHLSDATVHIGSLAARVGAKIQVVGPGWEGDAQIVKVELDAAATQ